MSIAFKFADKKIIYKILKCMLSSVENMDFYALFARKSVCNITHSGTFLSNLKIPALRIGENKWKIVTYNVLFFKLMTRMFRKEYIFTKFVVSAYR